MESGEGHSLNEMGLLPEEERRMLGKHNPNVSVYFFELRKTRFNSNLPKALWLLYNES